ncbi:hypothetical protein [Prochlorococcus marinus]|uniref:Plastid lipid-associated protein/fibrillin conserved domain-containing protein n=1 Tax=Prochlorococcus marinus (strain MIT 9211) TaxID=93059 RepID=A9B9P5_PROM4|nr:hypothetical protein [Prochlorococcus marinus]ABX08557.1 Hypothetical protein P9211_06261 [Prochlorococcus marinus str. MIT 9211]
MDLTKLLIIEGAVVLVGLPLFFVSQALKEKGMILDNFIENKLPSQNALKLPSKQKLLELERIARKHGSGIDFASLIGLWSFVYVWKKDSDKDDMVSSSLLRLFSASLDIRQKEPNEFSITNSIHFGPLSILFRGLGNLKGRQPLLPFFFDCIELKAGSRVVFNRSLQIPEEKNRPFFALISMGESCKWLSARGRGGGLALWIKG